MSFTAPITCAINKTALQLRTSLHQRFRTNPIRKQTGDLEQCNLPRYF